MTDLAPRQPDVPAVYDAATLAVLAAMEKAHSVSPAPHCPEGTLMTRQTVALPLDPARLADLLLAPAADANTIHEQLADQAGPRPARQLLAAAHSIAADRLSAEAA